MSKFKNGDRVFVEAEVDEIFAGEPEEHVEYPIGISIEGDSWATCTVNGRTSFNGKKVVYTEDELRELLTAKEPKPKDKLRYFYVNFYVEDTNGGGEPVAIPITHTRMFSRDGLRKYFASAFNTSLRAVRIISWQELTKEDYEAFTA